VNRASGTQRAAATASRLMARLVVVLAVVAAVLVVPGALDPHGLALPGAACAQAAPAAEGTQRIAVAVDPGVLGGGAGSICVEVPVGASGADVLVARAQALGRPVPRWASNGLLCALDGVPASGCGERIDGAYNYWAYFLGDGGSWSYAGTGPALRRATSARTEGWHFVAGAGNASDPPPRFSPAANAICPPPPPPPPVTSSPPAAGPATPDAPGNPGSAGGQAVSGGGPGGAASTPSTVDRDPATGNAGSSPGAVGDPARGAATATSIAGGVGEDESAIGDVSESSQGSSPPLAVIAVTAAVLVLGAAGVARSRRRSV
jgi:hypothetical protein